MIEITIDKIFADAVARVVAHNIKLANLEREDYEALSSLVESVLSEESENKAAQILKVEFLIDNQNFKEALSLQKKILQDDPDDTRKQIGVGVILFKMRQFEEAYPYLNIGIREFPDDEHLQAAFGVCCFKLGSPTTAKKYLQPLFESGNLSILESDYVDELKAHQIVKEPPLVLTNRIDLSRL